MGIQQVIGLTIELGLGSTWETAQGDISWTDITEYFVGGDIRRGRGFALDDFGSGTAQLIVRNDDRRFEPEHSGGAYSPDLRSGVPIRVWAKETGESLKRQFVGNVWGFRQQWGRDGLDPTVVLDCTDAFKVLNLTQVVGATISSALSGTMFGDVLDDISWPAADRAVSSGTVSLQEITVRKEPALAILKRIAKSEGGWAYVTKGGNVAFRQRFYRPVSEPTVTLTLGDTSSEDAGMDSMVAPFDDAQIWNRILTQRQGKTTVSGVGNALSIARYGKRILPQYNLLLLNQQREEAWARWILRTYKDPYFRAEASVALHRVENDIDKVLGLDVDKRVTVVREGGPFAGGRDMYIEGITHRFDLEKWFTGLSLSDAGMWAAWRLAIAGQSELAVTTWLGN